MVEDLLYFEVQLVEEPHCEVFVSRKNVVIEEFVFSEICDNFGRDLCRQGIFAEDIANYVVEILDLGDEYVWF